MSETIALKFAFMGLQKSDMVPVLYKIYFHGDKGVFQMSGGYSAYPFEEEVIFQDGLRYQVLSNMVRIDEKTGNNDLVG